MHTVVHTNRHIIVEVISEMYGFTYSLDSSVVLFKMVALSVCKWTVCACMYVCMYVCECLFVCLCVIPQLSSAAVHCAATEVGQCQREREKT